MDAVNIKGVIDEADQSRIRKNVISTAPFHVSELIRKPRYSTVVSTTNFRKGEDEDRSLSE